MVGTWLPDSYLEDSEDSTDSWLQYKPYRRTGGKCHHTDFAVNINRIKKRTNRLVVGTDYTSCKECTNNSSEIKDQVGNEKCLKSDISICLQCGHQGCDTIETRHAYEHYKYGHHSCHYMVVSTLNWGVWCYCCRTSVDVASAKNLQEAVEFIRGNFNEKVNSPIQHNFPNVGGLQNLGNTCFFNAVLQCLSQTPFLIKVLDDLRLPGQKFILPGGKHKLVNSSEEIELPPIEGTLEGWGSFTSILCKTLTEMQNSDGHKSYCPSELLNSFKKKTMQCMDGRQHDSHELLRHLLEIVRNEDLRRYQSIILKEVGLNEKTKPDGVDESLKARVKFYGNQASARLLGAELVFRGVLVSTLQCLDCHHTWQSTEPFLDLSLPVMADKPQPPVLRKNSGSEDIFDVMGNNITHVHLKYQLKQEKKAARKNRKNKRQEARKDDGSLPLKKNDIPKENTALESEIDADVEDNVEAENNLPNVGATNCNPEKQITMASSASPSIDPSATSTLFNHETLDNHLSLDAPNSTSPVQEENHSPTNSVHRKSRRKAEERSGEITNGVNGIASDISKIEIAESLQESPTRYPTKQGERSIKTCLNQFTALELMSGSNKVGCEACTAREKKTNENCKMVCTPSSKQYLISQTPAVLILHLKRFQAQRADFRKVTKHISFPMLLDLAPICEKRKKPRIYALYGVVEHRGTIHGGHYVAYVKSRLPLKSDDPRWSFLLAKDVKDRQDDSSSSDSEAEEAAATAPLVLEPPGKWYYVSDSRVRKVSSTNVLQSQAYLLFYERIL